METREDFVKAGVGRVSMGCLVLSMTASWIGNYSCGLPSLWHSEFGLWERETVFSMGFVVWDLRLGT